jgi:hypothetical protein
VRFGIIIGVSAAAFEPIENRWAAKKTVGGFRTAQSKKGGIVTENSAFSQACRPHVCAAGQLSFLGGGCELNNGFSALLVSYYCPD